MNSRGFPFTVKDALAPSAAAASGSKFRKTHGGEKKFLGPPKSKGKPSNQFARTNNGFNPSGSPLVDLGAARGVSSSQALYTSGADREQRLSAHLETKGKQDYRYDLRPKLSSGFNGRVVEAKAEVLDALGTENEKQDFSVHENELFLSSFVAGGNEGDRGRSGSRNPRDPAVRAGRADTNQSSASSQYGPVNLQSMSRISDGPLLNAPQSQSLDRSVRVGSEGEAGWASSSVHASNM